MYNTDDIPKLMKFKGKLELDDEEKLTLTGPLQGWGTVTNQIFTIPLSEMTEEMIGKEVLIKVFETQDGVPLLDTAARGELNVELMKGTRQLRELLLKDKYRPGYHFTVPDDIGRPGDPNGAFFGKDGRYHLMYLYDRRDVKFCWGHISSLDLVHWRHHPDAIGPEGEIDGCFSGGAFVDDDGTAYLTYWIVQNDERPEAKKGIMIAKSSDRHYDTWENMPNVAIEAEKMGYSVLTTQDGIEKLVANADPSNIWKKDGIYYMQTGNIMLLNKHGRDPKDPLYEQFRGDWVDLFQSKDMETWEFVRRFYEFDPEKNWTDGTEDDMCPSFLPLPSCAEGGAMSDKYLQLFIAHNKGCQYYIGDYKTDTDEFIPEIHGRMSWVDNTFFAPEALIDGKGRQIMWAWLLDNPDVSKEDAIVRGWCGVFGLPRILWLGEDGTLRQKVPPEFAVLRHNEIKWSNLIQDGGISNKKELKGIIGDSCELSLIIDPKKSTKVGLIVCASPGGEEQTSLYYDAEQNCITFDSQESNIEQIGKPALETAPFVLPSGEEKLHLRVFIDKCVVEIFANDRQAITRRVFTTREDSLGVYIFSDGGEAEFQEIICWEMMPSNPY
jgi:beta-fructofuranosidase